LAKVLHHLVPLPWFPRLRPIAPRPATVEELIPIHSARYVHHAEAVCASGAQHLDSRDVGVNRASYEVALLAAGGALALADALVAGEIRNGFALVRPPGHHAEHDTAMGFCLFNNVAVLARYLQRHHGLDKIAIVDFDVHHGNGTQHSFEEDPSVLYVSLHQYPFYPGTGAATETGRGKGTGYTLNCPLPAGSTDADYERAMRERVLPRLAAYRPECVLISAGFDAHHADPLAEMRLSTAFYGWITTRLLEVADSHAGGRVLSLLEGGYNLEELPGCVAVHLATLANEKPTAQEPPARERA
jgi:acetoin utilization deacetylase AcuC-like enzyme